MIPKCLYFFSSKKRKINELTNTSPPSTPITARRKDNPPNWDDAVKYITEDDWTSLLRKHGLSLKTKNIIKLCKEDFKLDFSEFTKLKIDVKPAEGYVGWITESHPAFIKGISER